MDEHSSTVTKDYYGKMHVVARYPIRITEIAEVLKAFLVDRGEVQVEGYNKIPAIKYIREYYRHLGLREAKEAVEYIVAQEGEAWEANRKERAEVVRDIEAASYTLARLREKLERLNREVI